MSELFTRSSFGQFGGKPADISLAQFGVPQMFLPEDTTGGLGLPQVGAPASPTTPAPRPFEPAPFPFSPKGRIGPFPKGGGFSMFGDDFTGGGLGSLSPLEINALTRRGNLL